MKASLVSAPQTPVPDVLCVCGHPANQHGRSGCYSYVAEGTNGFCACQKRPEQVILDAAEMQLAQFREAVSRLLAYRRANTLNFQLEKLDDYLKALEVLMEKQP